MKRFLHKRSGRVPVISQMLGRLSRARYFRGHGVHSPFVYDIVREVFMKHSLQGEDRELYEALCRAGVSPRRAVQLQNLFSHCGYRTFGVDGTEHAALCVLTRNYPENRIPTAVAAAAESGSTLCIMEPYRSAMRCELCSRIVREHRSTTVDNRGYLLIFNNHLPKQHFIL